MLSWAKRRNALRRHLETDLPDVMQAINSSTSPRPGSVNDEERVREAEGACRCAESWIGYGLGGEYVFSMAVCDLLPFVFVSISLYSLPSIIARLDGSDKVQRKAKALTGKRIAN